MKSSSDDGGWIPGGDVEVPVATSLKLRGARGRLTARLVPGGIDQLGGRDWVLVGRPGGVLRRFSIEEYSIYKDNVVVKFHGMNAASAAAEIVGQDILIPCNGLVDLPEGSYYIFELIGLTVRTRSGREIGTVRGVVRTGGTPLLAIEPGTDLGPSVQDEILLPAARTICTAIDLAAGCITIDPPEGLLEIYGV